jgi:epoxyqueuosine reductase
MAPDPFLRSSISFPPASFAAPSPAESQNAKVGHTSQEVCPFNGPKFVQITLEATFLPRAGVHGAELIELMGMDQAEFSRRFKGSPVKRAKRRGLLRNVAVALGNWGSAEAVPVLTAALEDEEPLIREHAAWALGRIGTEESRESLASRLTSEPDDTVRSELTAALGL